MNNTKVEIFSLFLLRLFQTAASVANPHVFIRPTNFLTYFITNKLCDVLYFHMCTTVSLRLLKNFWSYKEANSFIHLGKIMPKNKKNVQDAKGKEVSNKNVSNEKGAIYCGPKNEVIMKIHAKPGAKESIVTDINDYNVGVQIAAPPVDGEANKELIRYLAEILKLRKSDLTLDKGSRSKEKTVVIFGMSLEDVISKTKAASKQL